MYGYFKRHAGAYSTVSSRRNADRTRQRILTAALEEFAAHGLAGARVDRIAAEAGVNKRMLYHYFQHKEGLYRSALATGIATIQFAGHDLAERLAVLAEHPQTLRLWAWQALDGAGAGEVGRPPRLAELWEGTDVAPDSPEAAALLGAAIVPALLFPDSASPDPETRTRLLTRLVGALTPDEPDTEKPRLRYRWR